ncbi:hypothetical protein [Jannaschia ovalis]|uniref:Uncharacterized protein n=1 Tax=Jannaschia ovalis TaxID=3038773 RepID=A0ABY8LB13_9RHOB|nr:hypothetical protein [Jannaschia sp. GRR-S6-38]WGH78456.1 hypothetical protein P8627_15770 [Jannaschia sp. GRR-S6-38]
MTPKPHQFWLDALAAGLILATAEVCALVWFDIGRLGSLFATVEGGQIALWVLWVALVSVMTPAAAATRLLAIRDRNHDPDRD